MFPRSGGNRFRGGADPDNEPDEKSLQKLAEATAVRLLARREHSIEELRRKLTARSYPDAVIDFVVTRLAAKRLVSDDRFTSSFVHHHAQRGQGPVRIRAELRQQGIADEAIESALESAEIDWIAQAQTVRRRKFGGSLPGSLPERAKQARFLQYRGFSADQIRAALKADVSVMDEDDGLDPDADL
ncbi:regulatory protein RecX [Povalibacter sp.]|uniref:regulatory protein RecX n=1 Tax=Povalibacter sp. TaxID=1962978 RepID=UPI002F41A0C8